MVSKAKVRSQKILILDIAEMIWNICRDRLKAVLIGANRARLNVYM